MAPREYFNSFGDKAGFFLQLPPDARQRSFALGELSRRDLIGEFSDRVSELLDE